MTIAVVIPTLNEDMVIDGSLRETRMLGFDHIIVVDGGSEDKTHEIVAALATSQPPPNGAQPQVAGFTQPRQTAHHLSPITHHSRPTLITLLFSPPGRARQMNRGARDSQADVFVFLHADTRLPAGARAAIETALAEVTCVGGRFDVRFERDEGWSWVIARMMNLRSRLSGIATGDQGMFVRRSAFEQLGGFAEIPIMEDVDFSRRLKQQGRLAALQVSVLTSFRRWEAGGPLRTILLMWSLRFLFWIGMSPERLNRFYGMVR